jgi:hypothetical protein
MHVLGTAAPERPALGLLVALFLTEELVQKCSLARLQPANELLDHASRAASPAPGGSVRSRWTPVAFASRAPYPAPWSRDVMMTIRLT